MLCTFELKNEYRDQMDRKMISGLAMLWLWNRRILYESYNVTYIMSHAVTHITHFINWCQCTYKLQTEIFNKFDYIVRVAVKFYILMFNFKFRETVLYILEDDQDMKLHLIDLIEAGVAVDALFAIDCC